MNIFILDNDPVTSVRYATDTHVASHLREISQMLSTAHHVCDGEEAVDGICKLHQPNHPVTKWVRESIHNYLWTKMFWEMNHAEWLYRFNKTHGSFTNYLNLLTPPKNILHAPMTRFPQCVPGKYRQIDTVQAYRDYVNGEKQHLFEWTNRSIPEWIE